MPEHAISRLGAIAPRIEYQHLPKGKPLPANVLFAVEFGIDRVPAPARGARVHLEPLRGSDLAEVWYANGPVTSGFDGRIRFATDDHHLAGAIEVDEREHGGLAEASAYAYRAITEFQARSQYRHLLRIWNYFDSINEGDGDAERYRIFCTGRTAGLAAGTEDADRSLPGSHGDRPSRRCAQRAGVLARRPQTWLRYRESAADGGV
jgi:chorismate lyase/3-hydroxybenzoate synthase